jgi:hypothetical protein
MPSVSHLCPDTDTSDSSSFSSKMRRSARQDVFPRGSLQMVPLHLSSCQGTRTEMCIWGNCRASFTMRLFLANSLHLYDRKVSNHVTSRPNGEQPFAARIHRAR